MRRVGWVSALVGAASLAIAARAGASCVVTNETGFAFVVASGNAADQKVAAHATTTIEQGKIEGKSPEGKTISGACKDGDRLVVVEKNGVPLLEPKGKAKPKAPAKSAAK
jgi:hypothetical protein